MKNLVYGCLKTAKEFLDGTLTERWVQLIEIFSRQTTRDKMHSDRIRSVFALRPSLIVIPPTPINNFLYVFLVPWLIVFEAFQTFSVCVSKVSSFIGFWLPQFFFDPFRSWDSSKRI